MAVYFILQTQNFPVTKLLLSGGVPIPPSGIVHSIHLPKVSTDLKKDTFDMTNRYKPIIGLGGGIPHIFQIKYVTSSKNHIVLFVIFGNKGFTTAVDERKAEVAILRKEDKRTIDYYTID